MNELYLLYEKLYFKSLEERDRAISRFQLNVTIYTAFILSLFYIIKSIDYNIDLWKWILVIGTATATVIFIMFSLYHAYYSIAGINKYEKLASCQKISEYFHTLVEYEKQEAKKNIDAEIKTLPIDISEDIKNFLCIRLGSAIDNNNMINEARMSRISKSTSYIWKSFISFFLCAGIFVAFDLDASTPRKNFAIEDKGVINVLKEIHSVLYKNQHFLQPSINNGDCNDS
ncbi:hypothetical protein [Providencia sp. PROV193]|uniref:hypothetical protein n=1 Tax=Providencia sp. PROV193 TaxID=2949894 RepID=UPI00234BAA20|nr:hypothetical protein [Providencia sp. PROV193]